MESTTDVSENTRQSIAVIPTLVSICPASLNDIISETRSATNEMNESTMLITESGDIFLSVNL